tara:strand:- start:75 stop:512 length:438 start_codon:yes stop_codon:yes gene_type:complete
LIHGKIKELKQLTGYFKNIMLKLVTIVTTTMNIKRYYYQVPEIKESINMWTRTEAENELSALLLMDVTQALKNYDAKNEEKIEITPWHLEQMVRLLLEDRYDFIQTGINMLDDLNYQVSSEAELSTVQFKIKLLKEHFRMFLNQE